METEARASVDLLDAYQAATERPVGTRASEDYMMRLLAEAQVRATLAVADELAAVRELLALSLDGERAFSVRQAGAWVTREDRP